MENRPVYSSHLSLAAEKDLNESFIWYEEQQKGLGSRFIDEALSRMHKIEQSPELFSIKFKSYREASMINFPFIIIYRINKRKNNIRFVSVFHTAKNPKKKYR